MTIDRATCVAALSVVSVLSACKPTEDDSTVYTLYRGSVTDPMRIHVATFDSADGEDYNRENCDHARGLFQEQPGILVKYWCEKGRYRK
jgi:hypothetical protein